MNAQAVSAPLAGVAREGSTLSWEDYTRFLPFVRRTAIRMARRAGAAVSVRELEGSGFVGLVGALSQSAPHASAEARDAYLVYRIRAAMLDFVSHLDARTHAMGIASRRLVTVIARLSGALSRAPAEAEIAQAMGLDGDAYQRLLVELAELDLCRLSVVDFDRADSPTSPEGVPSTPLDVQLAGAIAALPLLLQQILALRHQEQCSPAEIAETLDLDEPRVVAHYAEAIHRVRATIERGT